MKNNNTIDGDKKNIWLQSRGLGEVGASNCTTSLPGSFTIHENGEMDMRGIYCSLVVADILGIIDEELSFGVGDFVASCQTYEGGISCVPYGEAHGGYTFCGLAASIIVG